MFTYRGIILALSLAFGMGIQAAMADTCGLDKTSVQVSWTAYKTTQKTPVGGTFKKVDVVGVTSAPDLMTLAKGLEFVIDKTSVDSKNPGRDQTLTESFFSVLKGDIRGKITAVDMASHQLILHLQLNGKALDLPLQYEMVGQKFSAKGNMDILAFAGDSALQSLNKKCFDLHKGADGVSKTWSEVGLMVTGTLLGQCH
jgi:polyisoprenoid-binding protein YceI